MKSKATLLFITVLLILIFVRIQVLGQGFIHVAIWLVSLFLISFFRKYIFKRSSKGTIDDLMLSKKKEDFILERLRSQALDRCTTTLKGATKNLQYIETRNWRLHKEGTKNEIHNGSLSDVLHAVKLNQKNNFIVFGESGVGKTFAVFDYIRKRIDTDPKFAPLFISLSDWNGKKSLSQWTINKASKIYHLDKKKVALGLKRGLLFPIYDGLDRVKEGSTIPLFKELMTLTSDISIALVMKTETYKKLKNELTSIDEQWELPYHLFELKALKPQQVEDVLKANKEHQKLEIFRTNPKFKYVSRYPLFLNLMIGIDAKFIKNNLGADDLSHEHFFKQIWKWYELRMIDNSEELSLKRKIKIKVWLRKIAKNTGTFFMEELQPSFLEFRGSKVLYYMTTRLLGALLVCGAAGLFLAGLFDFWDAAIIGGIVTALIDLIKIYFNKSYTSVESFLKTKGYTHIPPVVNILKRTIPLILVLGIYYGFTTPRSQESGGEMLLGGLFSITEAVVGILIGILLSLFFGARSNWQHNHFDIRPVERMKGSLKNYFISGFAGGLLLGVIVVPVFYAFNLFTNDESSINRWLDQQLYVHDKYLFAGFAGFFLGYLFFGLFGFLQGDKVILRKNEKLEVTKRTPIKKSIFNGLKASLIFSLVTGALLGSYIGITEVEIKAVFKALITAGGFGVLAFAWFGGLDAICHGVLRGILALEFGNRLVSKSFLHKLSEIGFIRSVGTGYEFIHPSLRDYYKNKMGVQKQKPRMFIIPIVLLAVLLIPVGLKLASRFQNESHWQNEYGFNTNINSTYIHHYNGAKNRFIVKNIEDSLDRLIRIKTSGKIKLGSFVGLASSTGTKAGFLGMSLGDTWNRSGLEHHNHGALVFRKNNGPWIGFPENGIWDYGQSKSYMDFTIKNGDIFEALINDKEWENNSGIVEMTFENVNKIGKQPKIVAHRGGAVMAEENSMEAIKKAIQLEVDMIEIDIRITKDGHLVLMHDKSVNRTTDGKGYLKKMTFEDLKKLQLKNGEPIPTLEDVLDLISNHSIKLLIEVKTGKNYNPILENLVALIKKKSMEEQVAIFSFNKPFCKDLKNRFPEFTVGTFVLGPFNLKELPNVDAIGVHYHSLSVFKKWHKKLKKQYGEIYAWNVNSRKSMQRLINNGIDAIITDDPKKLQDMLSQ